MTDRIQIIDTVPHFSGHIVPCNIHYTGPANTKDYFTPSKEIDPKTSAKVCYYRGCKFTGKALDTEYTGYIMNKSEALAPGDTPDDFKVVNTYSTVACIEDISIYGHERMPKSTDVYNLIPDWQRIAEAIHTDKE